MSHSCASGWVSQNAKVARASASSLYLVFYYVGASTGGFYLHLFWEWRAWQGIVIGSLMVLAVTLTLCGCLGLYRKTHMARGALSQG